MKYIGLIDCNNFFVSCERLFRPDLAKKPVLVLSSNDGCVVARSQEVKDMGIPMGIPYFKVREKLKTASVEVFSSNITLYRDISRRVIETIASFDIPYEQYSVDEAFFVLDVDKEGIDALTLKMKERVEMWVGVPVSVGVGNSKVIAKYAGEKAKAGTGIAIIADDKKWMEEMKGVHVGALWGVGRKTTQKCIEHGLTYAFDIATADSASLERLLGVEGTRLKDALLGKANVSCFGEEYAEDQKSIMSSRSFGKTTESKTVLLEALSYHITHAAEKMRCLGQAATHMSVSIRTRRHSNYELRGGYRNVLFSAPVFDTRVLIAEAKKLLDVLYEQGVPYAKVGIVLGGFVHRDYISQSLFDSDKQDESNTLMGVVDTVNKKLGSLSIHVGTLRKAQSWETKSAYRSKLFTTSWTDIKDVKANI